MQGQMGRQICMCVCVRACVCVQSHMHEFVDLHVYVCVHMHVCVCMYVWVCARAHVDTRGCQRVSLIYLYLTFWDRGSPWPRRSLAPLYYLARAPRLCLTSTATVGLHYCTQAFTPVQRAKLRSTCLEGKHFTNWDICPAHGSRF